MDNKGLAQLVRELSQKEQAADHRLRLLDYICQRKGIKAPIKKHFFSNKLFGGFLCPECGRNLYNQSTEYAFHMKCLNCNYEYYLDTHICC